MLTEYKIGLCVQYDEDVFTLAGVRFKENGDIVIWSPTGDYGELKDRTKWDPHVTYHANGLYHLASYAKARHVPRIHRYPHEKNKQPINPSFSGYENLIVQGFGRDYAKAYGHKCSKFDACVFVDAMDIEYKESVISDHLGEIRTPVVTSSFQVDLIEPHRRDLVQKVVNDAFNTNRILEQELIEATFPWCLITVYTQI